MDVRPGQRHQSYPIYIILVLALVADQMCSRLLPWEKYLVGITPSVVFLDIPVPLPCTVALVPFFFFFIFFYQFLRSKTGVVSDEASTWLAKKRKRRVLGALMIWPVLTICAGMVYLLFHDLLPKGIQNALESFGINEDLYLPLRGAEVIHFRGSMLILGACWVGFYNLKRQLKPVPKTSPEESHAGKELPVLAEIPAPSPYSKKKEQSAQSAEMVK